MTKVKICGVTNPTDAIMAARAGADALGFNFWPHSSRYIEPDEAMALRLSVPPFVATVGVFVDARAEQVAEVMQHVGLDYAQLHGQESPRTIRRLSHFHLIKAIRVRSEQDLKKLESYTVDAFVLDAYVEGQPGGTGQTFDWDLARAASSRAKILLAGGLTPENVADAVRAARPYAVDVAGGVEEGPGKKSRELVTEFVRAAKGVKL